jgi:hypothetical protein
MALLNFSEILLKFLDKDKESYDHNSLIMSGGFKSTIPCLTLASFFFGIELLYIFESSNQLQKIHPKIDLSTEEKRSFWNDVWEELLNIGFKNNASCVRNLLEYRHTHPHQPF